MAGKFWKLLITVITNAQESVGEKLILLPSKIKNARSD